MAHTNFLGQGGGGKVSRTLYLVPPSIDAHRLFSFAGMVKSAASLRITLWNNALPVRTKVEVPGSSKMFSPQKSKLCESSAGPYIFLYTDT